MLKNKKIVSHRSSRVRKKKKNRITTSKFRKKLRRKIYRKSDQLPKI